MMTGILLAFQFFTAIPVRKELPLGRNEVTAMYIALPFVGGVIGLVMYGVAVLMLDIVGVSSLLAAVLIVFTGILLTGGLHLDGVADTGDAFFSYRDRAKRLEILDDPRLGAFGTMALIVMIVLKIALVNEILVRGNSVYFIAVPLLARAVMNVYFTTMPLAKDKGIAHFFKEKMSGRLVNGVSIGCGIAVLIGVGVMLKSSLVPLVLFAVMAIALLLYRRWSVTHFGGLTGDLLGAFIEGTEALLWLTVIVLI